MSGGWPSGEALAKVAKFNALPRVGRASQEGEGRMSRLLSKGEADAVEAEMRALEADPATTAVQMRLFMQSSMPCGHAVGNLLTCPDPPFGCVSCINGTVLKAERDWSNDEMVERGRRAASLKAQMDQAITDLQRERDALKATVAEAHRIAGLKSLDAPSAMELFGAVLLLRDATERKALDCMVRNLQRLEERLDDEKWRAEAAEALAKRFREAYDKALESCNWHDCGSPCGCDLFQAAAKDYDEAEHRAAEEPRA